MKKIFLLLSIILLAVGMTSAQKSPQGHFVKNGDVYVQYSNGAEKIVDCNNASDVVNISIAGKPFLYYWTTDNELWGVKLNSSGKSNTRFELTWNHPNITKIISTGDSNAIFTCQNGKRYKVKFQSSGRFSGTSQI